MNYKKPKSYTLTPSRKKLGRSVARGSRYSLAVQCWEDPTIKRYILKLLSVSLRREIAAMCSDKTNSLLKEQSQDCLQNFSWSKLEAELNNHAPTLYFVLHSCFTTKVPRQNSTYMLCTCACLMMRNRRPSMSLLQRTISILLYSGHCLKKVMK